MKKQLTMKLRLKKETLGHLSDQDMQGAAGGVTLMCSNYCQPTGQSYCVECGGGSGTTTALSGGSCPSGPRCCY